MQLHNLNMNQPKPQATRQTPAERRADIGAWFIVCVVLPLVGIAILLGSEMTR